MSGASVPLSMVLRSSSLSLATFLDAAIQLVHYMEQQQREENIHHHPLDPNVVSINLSEFEEGSVNIHDEPWIYMAPEQTGRMNLQSDYRSDFYSLGMMFYRMLTGHFPFAAVGKSEWIHAHLAKKPKLAHQQNPLVPDGISMLVDKLLAKSPEDRYQTIQGLAADLKYCRDQLQQTGKVDQFALAEPEDFRSKALSGKLYGREQSLSLIKDTFQWISLGSTQMICVTGPSGIGKTTLVQEAVKTISQGQAFFIAGKFYPYQDEVPFAALIHAFRELVNQLLKEDKRRLDQWKVEIKAALGSNGSVIAEVIPEIRQVIGETKPVEALGPEESIKRFHFIFRRFIQVLCNQSNPLILFLDDLQWVDAASWRMISSVMTDPQSQSLLLIGAYRDDAHGHIYHLSEEIEEIEKTGVTVHYLPLSPLTAIEMNRMLADRLGGGEEAAITITELCLLKTGGNPLLIHQWFQSCLEENIFRYDEGQGKWTVHHHALDPIERSESGDLLSNYMISVLDRLPAMTRQVVLEASCLGNEFHAGMLSSIRQETVKETLETIRPADKLHLVTITGSQIKFAHDRVRETAYMALDKEKKRFIHWKAGQYLLNCSDHDVTGERLFEIVNQLNKGSIHAVEPNDRDTLIRMNTLAGNKAKSATAFEAALIYYRNAAERIAEADWSARFDYCFDLFVHLVECEYICGQISSADETIAMLRMRCRNALDRSRLQMIAIGREIQSANYEGSIRMGLSVLRDLGISITNRPGKVRLLFEIWTSRRKLQRYRERLDTLPEVTSNQISTTMRILADLIGPVFLYNRELSVILICKLVKLSLRHGNSPYSATVYANFGAFLSLALGDNQGGYELAEQSLKLAQKHNLPSVLSRIHIAYGSAFYQWEEQEEHYESHFEKSVQYGLESGDFIFTGHAVSSHVFILYLRGQLEFLIEIIPSYIEILGTTRNQYLNMYLNIIYRWAAFMTGTEDAEASNDKEADFVQRIRDSGMEQIFWFPYYCCQMQEHYLFGRIQEAVEAAEKAKEYEKHSIHFYNSIEFYYYYGLSLASQWQISNPGDTRKLVRTMKSCLKRMHAPTKSSGKHVRHKVLLIEAEMARIQGNRMKAIDLYDEAIREAYESGHLQHEAVANERAAGFYLSQSKEMIASSYLVAAYRCHREWGAVRKSDDMKEAYRSLHIQWDLQIDSDSSNSRTGFTNSQEIVAAGSLGLEEAFDLSVLVESNRSLAEESDQRQLINKLVRTVVENAGAQKGCMITEEGHRLYVTAYINDDGTFIRDRKAIEDCPDICKAAVQYAVNTLKPLLLEDAVKEGPLTRELYVINNRTKSLLCLPLQLQGRLSGILYLENNLVAGAFLHERLMILRLLASQIIFLMKLFPHKLEPDVPKTRDDAIDAANVMDPLTNRELEVLQLMSLGMSNKEISERLGLVVGTVKLHINRIFNKMNVNRRTKAVHEAKKRNLLED